LQATQIREFSKPHMTKQNLSTANRSDPQLSLIATEDRLSSTHTQELVIALCGPMGSPLNEVSEKLREILMEPFNYKDCKIVKLSKFIEDNAKNSNITIATTTNQRLHDLINHGNKMRKDYGPSVLAELAIHKIRVNRELEHKDRESGQYIPHRTCHIINSIKNQAELNLLRTVYREVLYVVGVFAPISQRESRLQNKGLNGPDIAKLMDRDSGEECNEGQKVTDTFPQSDFFLRINSITKTEIENRVKRFLNLILEATIITPTRAETAMYAAASAAGNSACLSRQVGAAVTDSEGELLSIGWNDVPKAFGDLYITNPKNDPVGDEDKRCWNHGGKCYNDEEKNNFAEYVVEELGDIIEKEKRTDAIKSIKNNKKLRNLIEFSRSIHAEMHAILTALRQKGDKVRGGHIYITTYPCHSCARHIIAAGIKEVYYIEPYKKSLATKLHGDAMTEIESDKDKVRLIPYDGVAPSRYLSLFKMKTNSRKDSNGKLIRIVVAKAEPRLEKSLEALPALEALVVKSLEDKNLVNKP
jgi:deoxycytidylate deaminase